MKKTLILIFLSFVSVVALWAQQPDQKQPPQAPTFRGKFIVEDIMFVANVINSVEISGAEVDGFIQCKNSIGGVMSYVQSKNMRTTDTLELSIEFPVGRNLITFLARAKFTGAQVMNYKRFTDVLLEGLQPPKPGDNKGNK